MAIEQQLLPQLREKGGKNIAQLEIKDNPFELRERERNAALHHVRQKGQIIVAINHNSQNSINMITMKKTPACRWSAIAFTSSPLLSQNAIALIYAREKNRTQ